MGLSGVAHPRKAGVNSRQEKRLRGEASEVAAAAAGQVGNRGGQSDETSEALRPGVVTVATQTEISVPDEYRCPISTEIMVDPVMNCEGQTYERSAIERWFCDNNTDPNTNEPCDHTRLTQNHSLRSLIQSFMNGEDIHSATAKEEFRLN